MLGLTYWVNNQTTGDNMANGGALIKIARKAREYSQEKLAFNYGMSKGTVQNWEAGRTAPSFDDVIGVLDFLHFDIAEVMQLAAA